MNFGEWGLVLNENPEFAKETYNLADERLKSLIKRACPWMDKLICKVSGKVDCNCSEHS